MSAPATAALARLEKIVGAGHLATDAASLAGYEVDGIRPTAAARPGSTDEVAEVIRCAAAERLAVIPAGACTKLRIGNPPTRYDVALDMSRLNRVLAYDPADLTLGVETGIGFAKLNGVLAAERQFLPLAPAFSDRATIGGILATNSGTPLRHAYGSARDYVLGIEFVTGEGVLSKSGGRVVKNVTGYDLHKLMIGALGTLGVITRVNFRTFPIPQAQTTFVASFLCLADALSFCGAIAQSPLQPRLVEVLEPQAARIVTGREDGARPILLSPERWSVVVAAAGNERVVERHGADLSHMAQEARAAKFAALTQEEKETLLERIREFPRLVMEFSPAATIFRIGVLPSQMRALLERAREITQSHQIASAALVRASGVVYLALLPARDALAFRRLAHASAELIATSSSSQIGGRPMMEWCPSELKRQINLWGPAREDLFLMQRLKKAFDPQGILSPGRFFGGI